MPPFGLLRASNFARSYGLGASLGEALAALALSVRYTLPLAGRRQLRDGSRFLSNCATAPRTWRTRTAVGVSSTKNVGADAAMRLTSLALRHVVTGGLAAPFLAGLARQPPPPRPARSLGRQRVDPLRQSGKGGDRLRGLHPLGVSEGYDAAQQRVGTASKEAALRDADQGKTKKLCFLPRS